MNQQVLKKVLDILHQSFKTIKHRIEVLPILW